MRTARAALAIAACCALGTFAASAAEAHSKRSKPPADEPRIDPNLRDPSAGRSGAMVPLLPLGEDAAIGVGRFSVPEPPRPRTNLERERAPSDLARERQGIGGLGLRMNF